MKKFNLAFTLLAASSLLAVGACQRAVPMNANNDFACRDNSGRVVDDDYCDPNDDDYRGGMFLWMSSGGYHSRYGKYPHGYNPKAYSGKTISSSRAKATSYSAFRGTSSTSRGGFGSTGRGFSSGG